MKKGSVWLTTPQANTKNWLFFFKPSLRKGCNSISNISTLQIIAWEKLWEEGCGFWQHPAASHAEWAAQRAFLLPHRCDGWFGVSQSRKGVDAYQAQRRPFFCASQGLCGGQKGDREISHQRVDKDSLGQHYVTLKPNSMLPQTFQPLQSHPCLFHVFTWFSQISCSVIPFVLPHQLPPAHRQSSLSQTNPIVPRFGKDNTHPKGNLHKLDVSVEKMLCSPALLFLPLVLSLAIITGWVILVWTFCLDILLTLLAPGWLSLTLIKSWWFCLFVKLWSSQCILNHLKSQQETHHILNVLFFFGDLLFCVFKSVFTSTETPAQVLSSFVNTTGYDQIFFFHLTFLVNRVATQIND